MFQQLTLFLARFFVDVVLQFCYESARGENSDIFRCLHSNDSGRQFLVSQKSKLKFRLIKIAYFILFQNILKPQFRFYKSRNLSFARSKLFSSVVFLHKVNLSFDWTIKITFFIVQISFTTILTFLNFSKCVL